MRRSLRPHENAPTGSGRQWHEPRLSQEQELELELERAGDQG